MNMKKNELITIDHLKAMDACVNQIALFAEVFPQGASLTLENLQHAAKAGLRIEWFAEKILPPTALTTYEQAKAPAWAAYEQAKAPAWAAYEQAIASAWATFRQAKAPAWAAYEQAKAPAWAAYEQAIAPAWATFRQAIAPAWAAYEQAIASALWDALED